MLVVEEGRERGRETVRERGEERGKTERMEGKTLFTDTE